MGLVITIEKMGARGVGLGRHDGKVVMVGLAAPGDKAEVEIIRRHRHFDEGRVLRLLEPSSLRRDPPCPYFGRCGGCQLQHLPIINQRGLKESLFREMLLHQGLVPEAVIAPLLCTSKELGYRAHLEVHLSPEEKPYLGFMGWGENKKITRVDTCLLALPALQSVFSRLQDLAGAGILSGWGRLALSCDAPGESAFVCLLPAGDRGKEILGPLVQGLAEIPSLRGMAVLTPGGNIREEWRREGEPILGTRYGIPLPAEQQDALLEIWPGVFRQANPEGNRTLVSLVIEFAARGAPQRVADLYAGVGNFAVPLSCLAKEVTAVEGNARAVENGRSNSLHWGRGDVRWHTGAMKKVLGTFIGGRGHFDLVVMDPPRVGAKEILGELIALGPERIVYVSCDPATLVRDLGVLLKAGTYRAVKIQPLDMFPQTFHLESVTLLERG